MALAMKLMFAKMSKSKNCAPIFDPIMFKPFLDGATLQKFCAKCQNGQTALIGKTAISGALFCRENVCKRLQEIIP